MKCADTGFIQTFLDGECGHQDRERFLAHLERCAECRQQMEELSALEEWTRQTMELEFFRPTEKAVVDTQAAWQTFSQRIQQDQKALPENHANREKPVVKRSWRTMKKSTKQWVTGASAAAVLVVSLSFPQVQAAANDLLSIFRMDKVEFVKVTQEDLQEVESWLSSGQAGEMELKGIGKLWIDESGQEGERYRSYNTREAAEKAGVKLPDLPKEMKLDGVDVSASHTIHLEIDAEKANKLLSQLKMDARFDEKLSGKRFSLEIPEMHNFRLLSGEEFIQYGVIDAPELKAPEGVDLAQLRETLLALPFIPDQVKKQMLSVDDWQHTLPLPYMAEEGSKMREVKVHGQDALLMTYEYGSTLVWQQDGAIHTLESLEKNGDELLAIAKNM